MNIFKIYKENKALHLEVEKQKQIAENFKLACHNLMERATPELVIERLLNRGIKWFDPATLKGEEYKQYYKECQAILISPAFLNESNAYIKDLMEHIAQKSKDHDETKALRYSINGVKTLEERFKKVRKPENVSGKPRNPYAPL